MNDELTAKMKQLAKEMAEAEEAVCHSFEGDEDHSFSLYTVDKTAHDVFHELCANLLVGTDSRFPTESRKIWREMHPGEEPEGKLVKITVEIIKFDDESEHVN